MTHFNLKPRLALKGNNMPKTIVVFKELVSDNGDPYVSVIGLAQMVNGRLEINASTDTSKAFIQRCFDQRHILQPDMSRLTFKDNPERFIEELPKAVHGTYLWAETHTIDIDAISSQYLAQIKDVKMIEQSANNLGLELTDFLSNRALELFYEIKKEDRHICVIYKGWDDPGFRLSEILTCHPKNVELIQENIGKASQTCANEGITFHVDVSSEGLGIELAINIYQEGFNTGVLKEAVKTLEYTVNKIKEMLKY